MKVAIVAVVLVLLTRTARADEPATEPPPVTIGQLGGGLLLGGVLGLGTGALGVAIMEKRECEIDRNKGYDAFEGPCFRRSAYGFTIGASLGLGLGFHLIGRLVGVDNSFLITTGGAVVGALGGAVISELIIRDGGPSDVRNVGLGMLVALTGPIIGAIAGYHYARRPTSTKPGLVRFERGRLQLGTLAISHRDGNRMLSLVGGSF